MQAEGRNLYIVQLGCMALGKAWIILRGKSHLDTAFHFYNDVWIS
jgi:hypothetical protein